MNIESLTKRFGWSLSVFALGAAMGSTIALLVAPRSGRETRQRLKNAGLDLGKVVEHVPGVGKTADATDVPSGQAAFVQARGQIR